MIIVVTYRDEDDKVRVSHGVDTETLQDIVLPDVLLSQMAVRWHTELQEWVLTTQEV